MKSFFGDGFGFWLLAHEWSNNNFLAFEIDQTGVSTSPIISSVGTVHGVGQEDENFGTVFNFSEAIGQLKISPDGNKIATAKKGGSNSGIEIFDFNSSTGVVSNPILINEPFVDDVSEISGAYGIEFSGNSDLLYVTDYIPSQDFVSRVHQFNLTVSDVNSITNSDTIIHSSESILGALQLAIDGKIYVSNFSKTSCFIKIANEKPQYGHFTTRTK